MNAEQAFQAALGQLQLEMPAATYRTWVHDVQLVEYTDDTFVVSSPTSSARDWLEGRLSTTFTRLFSDIMNTPIAVRFVLQQPQPEVNSKPQTDLPDLLALDLKFASLYSEIVKPNRKVVLPVYFLRHLPYLGPTAAWILVAFKQIAYLSRAIEGPLPVKGKEIARWAGISERTFWRELGKNSYLSHFVSLHRSQAGVTDKAGRTYKPRPSKEYSRDANRYTLLDDMPLTPGDHKTLQTWLTAHGAEEDIFAALSQALKTDRNEILPDPWTTGTSIAPEKPPVSVKDAVMIFCEGLSDVETIALDGLIEALTTHLITRPKDIVVLTWYFLQNWVPVLGVGPAWAITLLRDLAFQDEGKGIVRKKVFVKNGWPELAWKVGVSTDAVKQWFTRQTKKSNDQLIEWTSIFSALGESTKQSDQSVSQEIYIEINEPLIPEDAILLSTEGELAGISFALSEINCTDLTLAEVTWDPTDQKIIINTEIGKGQIPDNDSIQGAENFVSFSMNGAGNIGAFSIEPIKNFVSFTQDGKGISDIFSFNGTGQIDTNSKEGIRAFVTILKLYLNLLSGNLYFSSKNSQEKSISESKPLRTAEEEVYIPKEWILDDLFAIAKVGIPKRQELRELGVSGNLWVAHLLFAHSPSQNPKSPLGLAISNLTKLQRYPDEDLEYLAKIPPGELANLLFWQLDPDEYIKPMHIPLAWKRAMEKISVNQLHLLISMLFRQTKMK